MSYIISCGKCSLNLQGEEQTEVKDRMLEHFDACQGTANEGAAELADILDKVRDMVKWQRSTLEEVIKYYRPEGGIAGELKAIRDHTSMLEKEILTRVEKMKYNTLSLDENLTIGDSCSA